MYHGWEEEEYILDFGRKAGRLGTPRWESKIKIDSIVLAQDRDQWRALVNTVVDLQVPYNIGKYLSS
jgi:hypothetical protein